jgi:glycosyltransferase involved in cell wall biosynthesis
VVAQVIGRFVGGGAERLAYHLAAGLAARAARSYAVAVRTSGLSEAERASVPVVDLGATHGWASAGRALYRFRRFITENGVDVVHIHGHSTLIFCALATRGLRQPVRLLFTHHASDVDLPERGPAAAVRRWALRRCDGVFASSHALADLVTRVYRLERPAQVFRNGIPAAAAPARRAATGTPLVVWTARLTPGKDPQTLVRAAARLRDEGLAFRIVLAGAAPAYLDWYRDQTVALVRQLRLEDLISLPGWIDDPRGLYAEASIAVQSSLSEGLSIALLEQMMAGLPIVATDVGDTRAAIEHDRTGLLIPAGDEAALAAAIRRLLGDPQERRRLGAGARARALAEFTAEAMAERALKEYRAVVAGG